MGISQPLLLLLAIFLHLRISLCSEETPQSTTTSPLKEQVSGTVSSQTASESRSNPEIISVQKAKVKTLTANGSPPTKEKTRGRRLPGKVVTSYAVATADAQPTPLQFSKVISNEPKKVSPSSPIKVSVSLFQEEEKGQQGRKDQGSSLPLLLQQFGFGDKLTITDFKPMKMVENAETEKPSSNDVRQLTQFHLHPPQPLPQAQPIYHPALGLNYQYYNNYKHHIYNNAYRHQVEAAQQQHLQELNFVQSQQQNKLTDRYKYEYYQNEVEPHPLPVPQLSLPQYNFAYRVHDTDTGNNHGHTQVRTGDVVHGRYIVMDADGLMRTVSYVSDPIYGFNAMVDRQPLVGVGQGHHYAGILRGHPNPGFYTYA